MAKTIIEQVAEALAAAFTPAALAAAGGPAGVTFYRNRRDEVLSTSWPALVQLDADADTPPPDQSNFGIDLYTVPVELIGYVGTLPTVPMVEGALGAALDALYGATVKVAMTDPSFGGLAVVTLIGHTQRAIDRESGTSQAQFSVMLEIEIATQQGNPFSLPT
jgi:hypothetical protein